MSLVTHAIRAITQGVSQQTPSVRLDSQVEEQVNMVSDLAFGLIKRNPAELYGYTAFPPWDQVGEDFMFDYTDLDGFRTAIGIKQDGTFYRFDGDVGNPKVVFDNIPAVNTYLAHTDINDLEILETKDNVYILNKKSIATETITPFSRGINRGLIWLTSVFEGDIITLTINRGSSQEYTRNETVAANDTPNSILNKFRTHIDANYADFNGWGLQGNSMTMDFVSDFATLGIEFFSGNGFNVAHSATDAFSNIDPKTIDDADVLPSSLSHSGVGPLQYPFVVAVNATRGNESTLYLGFNESDNSWVETSESSRDLDNITMPHVIRKYNAQISIFVEDWAGSIAGDRNSNKSPSFVDDSIKDMILFNGRLCLASGNSLSFSEASIHNNFYRTTTSTILSSDRVDIDLDASKLLYRDIEDVMLIDSKLIVNTGDSQAVLTIPTDLDLTKATFNRLSALPLRGGKPFPVRSSMYFKIADGNGFSNIIDYAKDTGDSFSDNKVTRHCEKYIKGNIKQGVYTNGLLFVRADGAKNTLYVQSTYINNGVMAQNAWSKWVFKYPIKYIFNIGNDLHVVFEDVGNATSMHCKINLVLKQVVEDFNDGVPANTVIGYFPYLDFYVTDSTNNLNTLVDRIAVEELTGQVVTVPVVDGVLGLVIGIPFEETSVTLSEQVPRTADGEVKVKLGFAKMMLRRFQGTLGFSGRLEIHSTKTGRGTNIQKHVPETEGSTIIGREPVSDSDLKFSVNGRAQDVEIKILDVGNFTPMQIISLEYQAQIIVRGSRI